MAGGHTRLGTDEVEEGSEAARLALSRSRLRAARRFGCALLAAPALVLFVRGLPAANSLGRESAGASSNSLATNVTASMGSPGPAKLLSDDWRFELESLQEEKKLFGQRFYPATDQCGPAIENWIYYTESHVAVFTGVDSWETCCTRCRENNECSAWSWGKADAPAGLAGTCLLKSINVPDPLTGRTEECPVQQKLEGVISGLPARNPNLRICFQQFISTTTTTTTITISTSVTTTTSTTTTTGIQVGGRERLSWAHVWWIVMTMSLLALVCLAAAGIAACALNSQNSESRDIRPKTSSDTYKDLDRQAQLFAEPPPPPQTPPTTYNLVPVVVPEPQPPNLEDTYSQGFLDGMITYLRTSPGTEGSPGLPGPPTQMQPGLGMPPGAMPGTVTTPLPGTLPGGMPPPPPVDPVGGNFGFPQPRPTTTSFVGQY